MLDLKELLSKARLPLDITRRGFLEVSTVAAAMAAMNTVKPKQAPSPISSSQHQKASSLQIRAFA